MPWMCRYRQTLVVTLLVSSRGWSFLRVVFSQTRNFTAIAFTGWTYCIEIFHLALKNTVPWHFSLYGIYFLHSGVLSNLHALALKNRGCPEFTVLNIYFLSFRIWATYACSEKHELLWNVSMYWNIFIIQDLSNLHLTWKQFALIHCIEYIFFIIQDLSNLLLPSNVSLYWNIHHSGFLSNLRLPWKQGLPWNFQCIEIFLSFRIWATCACLKTKFALKPPYWIYIFYHSGFLSNLR